MELINLEEDWGLECDFRGYHSDDNSYQKCIDKTQQFKTKTVKVDLLEKRKKSLKSRINSIENKLK